MKPYYQDKSVTIWHGDCREILPTLPKVDLVLTDPPFGVGNFVQVTGNVRGRGEQIGVAVDWNDRPPTPETIRLVKAAGKHSIIWGANHFDCFDGMGAIVWIKNQPCPNMSKAEIASCSFFHKTEIVEITWHNFRAGILKETSHPCERPLELYTWCINYAPNPQTIIDPYMGSGTVLRAAKNLCRQSIGIELEERYCEIAAKRMAQEVFDFSENNCGQQLATMV